MILGYHFFGRNKVSVLNYTTYKVWQKQSISKPNTDMSINIVTEDLYAWKL